MRKKNETKPFSFKTFFNEYNKRMRRKKKERSVATMVLQIFGLNLSQKRNVPLKVLQDLVISCCYGTGAAMSRSLVFLWIEKWEDIFSCGIVATIPFSTHLLEKFFFFFESIIFVRVPRWNRSLERRRKIHTWRVNSDDAAFVRDLIRFISTTHKDSCNNYKVPVQSGWGVAQKDSR